MEMGKILKYYRLKKGMSQEETAESIVSPSYLSRIENNKTTVEKETLILLLQRVGVDYEEIQADEGRIKKLLHQWEEPLLDNKKDECERIYKELQPLIHPVTHTQLQAEFHIKKVRAAIILDFIDEVDHSLRFIDDFFETLSSRNRFFYYKHLGNYYWVVNEPDKAKGYFERGLAEYSSIHLSELEQADLYFLYALSLYVLQKETVSFSYAQSALTVFQNNYKPRQCLKIHIHIGICFSSIGDVHSALSNFEKAKTLAEEIDDRDHLGVIYHNLATMHLRKKERDLSITHLKKAMYYKEQTSLSYFKSLVLLLFVYIQEKKNEECLHELDSHTKIAEQLPSDNVLTKEFWFFYSFFKAEEKKWEEYVKKEFMPTLKKYRKIQEVERYSRFLGEYYEAKGGYKKAASYYKLALDYTNAVDH
ncbi:helix-turn-helix transcriptional regulator [Halobacillus sp. HZG1]|uniref:helix-turn-helix domain-containing protein n=1 Tax=Halobacillus sp. HZG1 TaxID=3111769 RepID=UPI002DBE2F38|nr:helix-turn-helix transcriptional regulator [Halobacillus sp. HZG1]MEC3884050.1 helix-turn-helix transcriptional regulator [Halobacillus sp. HZG1]